MLHTQLLLFANDTSEKEGFAALGFDPKAFLIQLITFLFVFYILYRFVFARVVAMLEARREAVEEGLRLTTEMQAERDKLEQEVIATRKKARREADEIVSASHERAGSIIKEAEDKAQAKVDTMMVDAKKRIDEETARARRKLEGEILDLVVEATEAVTKEKLDPRKDATLVENALRGQIQDMSDYSRTKLANYIANQLDDEADQGDLAIQTASYLLDSAKKSDLDSLMRDVMETRMNRGIVELTARTAYPLGDIQKRHIKDVIKKHYPHTQKVIIHEVKDPEVVGGIAITLPNADLDMTIKAKLNQIRKSVEQ